MSIDWQAKYNRKNTQYKNACKQLAKKDEEIRILKSNRPPRLTMVEKPIAQTPNDKIIDSKEVDLEIERTKQELDKKFEVEKDHNYYRQVSSMMYNHEMAKARKNPSVYREPWYNLVRNFWKYYQNKPYSEKQKNTMDGWVERNKITIR